jgi:hypothetical protein
MLPQTDYSVYQSHYGLLGVQALKQVVQFVTDVTLESTSLQYDDKTKRITVLNTAKYENARFQSIFDSHKIEFSRWMPVIQKERGSDKNLVIVLEGCMEGVSFSELGINPERGCEQQ